MSAGQIVGGVSLVDHLRCVERGLLRLEVKHRREVPLLHVLDLPAAQLEVLPLEAFPPEERADLRVERARNAGVRERPNLF